MDMESVGNPEISPDGRQIIFTRTWVDKVKDQYRSNLWITDLNGARIRELTSGARNDSAPEWSPDGKCLAFTAFAPDTEPILNIRLPERPRGAEWARPAVLVDRLSWAADGRG